MVEIGYKNATEARRARAKELKDVRNFRYAYNSYQRALEEQQKEIEKAETVAKLKAAREKDEKENANFFVRAFSTVGDLVSNVVTGALKGLEGIYDLGAGLVGAVGGIFSKDFQNSVKDHIAYDFVGTHIGDPLQELTKYSYTNDGWFGQTLENIASGVGQMLPAVAVNLIPGVGQGVSMAMFASMAAGNATEEAYNDGASYWGGLGYGVASGAVELATEKMFGGATKNIFGKGYLDDIAKNTARKGIARVARNAVEEGIEEATSELVNPLLKNIYKDKGFFDDFLTKEHLKNIGTSALVGAGTSVVYGETAGRIGRRAANISESVQDLEGLAKKEENLWANDKLDDTNVGKITKARQNLYENISKELRTANEKSRTKLLNQLENYGYKGLFNADGTIVEQNLNTEQNASEKAVASYNKAAYTPSLQGKEKSLLYAPTSKALTEVQIEAKKIFNSLNKGNVRSNFVITDSSLGKDSNGVEIKSAYADGTLYINSKANAAQALVEYEMTHSLEGTKAYNKYASYVLDEIANNETLKKAYGDINELYDSTVNKYTEKLVKEAVKKGEQKLSDEIVGRISDIAQYNTLTEVVARFTSENLFTNTEQITKLAQKEPSVLKKLASWIKNKAAKLSKGNAEQIEVSKFLTKATKLYNQALEASFGGVGIDNLVRDVYNKEKGEIDNVREQGRNLYPNEGEKWLESKDSVEQNGRLQEESRESGQSEDSGSKRKISRSIQTEEREVRKVKIKQIDHKDWDKFEKKLASTIKKNLAVEVEFYDGSAVPPGFEDVDGGFDGFMDSKNNKMYLRSDATLSESEIVAASIHESVHHIKAVNPETYQNVEDAIFRNIYIADFAELNDTYSEAYGEVYNGNEQKIHEEIIADIVAKRTQAGFANVEEVNSVITDMFKAFNNKAKPSGVTSGDLKYAQGVESDSEGTPLSPAQAKYFKDSKVRDSDGNLKVVYHGSPFKFTKFENKGSNAIPIYGQGHYFTDEKQTAKLYSGENGGIYETYLNITNPYYATRQDEYWLKTSELQKQGYDGVIADLGGEVYYVAFNSNQIKEITNLNPTINDDIRYVINKNKDIKDLVVVHNLSENKLLEAIDLGGLAVPSIAITKDSTGHNNFGEISLIFKSDTIDPSKSYNKVYESDVYSKRFPKTINKISSKNLSELLDTFKESAKVFNSSPSSYESELEETSKLNAVETLSRVAFVKYHFLKENGIDIQIKQRQKQGRAGVPMSYIKEFADKHKDLTKSYYETDFVDTLIPEITEIYNKMYKDYGVDKEKSVSYTDADRFLYDVGEYNKNGEAAFLENDIYSLREDVDKEIKKLEDKFNNYVVGLVDKYYDSEKYFRNNVDLFTNAGNRRSFNALYEEANLRNIVKYMTGRVRNEEGFNYGAGSIRSVLSRQFKTLNEIKEARYKIVDSETMKKLKEETDEATFRIAAEIAKLDRNSNSFMATDNALDFMAEIARSSGTESRIIALFEEYYNALPSEGLVKDIQDYMKQLVNYPTEYFEAKPQRAVYFSEIVEVIAPVGINTRILDFFADNGIKVEFYDDSTTSRSELIKSLPEDIKFALTRGQVRKETAKASRAKVYNKVEAEQIINKILSDAHTENYVFTSMSGAKKSEIVDKLWIILNSKDEGFRAGAALDVANFLIENAAAESIWEDNTEYQMAAQTISDFSDYKKKIAIDSIKSEIRHRFDDKSQGIFNSWGARKDGVKLGIFDAVAELQGKGYFTDNNIINDADMFIDFVERYNHAKRVVENNKKSYMKELASESELKQLKQDIAREVLLSFDNYGTKTRFAKTIEKYQRKITALTEQLKDTRERNKAINNLFETIDRVKALEKYKAADIELAPEVTRFISLLKKIKTWRGNLANNVREIMNTYAQDVEGKKLYELIANEADGIKNPTAQLIEDIARNRGELTTTELKNLDLILRNFIHNVKNYDRVFFEGRNQSDTKLAEQAIEETQKAIKVKDEGFTGAVSKFTRWLQAPVWRFERLSSYRKDGFMTKVFKELQEGVDKKALFEMQVAKHYEDFFKENKKLVKQWREQTIEIDGKKLSKGQMISLYMLSLRKQALTHLFTNETQDAGVVRLSNEKYASKNEFRTALNKGEDFSITPETITQIENSLTEVDKKFIELTRQFFDEMARTAKHDTDMALFGISNVGEENYIPIRVASDEIYKQVGNESLSFNDLFSVYSPSFNKDVKPNAKNKIVVENILDIVNRHTKQMAAYYGLAIPVKSFNRVYNKKLENGSKLRTEIAKVDSGFEDYVGKLLADLQGNIKQRSGIDKLVSKVRGLGAKAALGLNLKVLANQFVSLPAAAAVGVKYKNLMKGFGMALAKKTDYNILTQYAPMLYERFREGSTIDVGLLKEGTGVLGKIDALTDITTAPIGKIDQFICGAVWNACLEQTKNSSSYENYSDEHYKAAAKLTEEAVIKTQSNYTALYRPAILREQNSFLQLSTMFMSEPLQQFSLLTSAIDKIRIARIQLKSADAETIAEAKALMKTATQEATRAIAAVVVDSIILTLIAQLFRWIKGQDDEDEDKINSILTDFAENYIGMLPFVKDVYSYLQGYEASNMVQTGLSNTAMAFKEMYNIIDLLASGNAYDQAQINGKLRKILLGITQMTGIPLRNLETYCKGIIEKFSPSGVYKYEKFFYDGTTSSYTKELIAAIEDGDDKLADTILDSFLTEEKIPVKDRELRNVLKDLYAQGFSVFPKSVGKSITLNGETITLTNSQRNRFRSVYQEANTPIKAMVNSDLFKSAEAEIQAKAIKAIYDYYYDLALEDLTGEEVASEKDKLFYAAIPIEELAIIIKTARAMESDKDDDGNTISGSKKRKVQDYISRLNLSAAEKYMIMGYLGYKNAVGKMKVKVYIQRLNMTRAEKEALLKYCGY